MHVSNTVTTTHYNHKKNKILNGIIQKLKKMELDSASEATKAHFNTLKKSIANEGKNVFIF